MKYSYTDNEWARKWRQCKKTIGRVSRYLKAEFEKASKKVAKEAAKEASKGQETTD
jgi:hypothetical protein